MVRPEGVEPPTYWFVASCSIQLSYGRTLRGKQPSKNTGIRHLEQTSEDSKVTGRKNEWCARKDSNLRPFGGFLRLGAKHTNAKPQHVVTRYDELPVESDQLGQPSPKLHQIHCVAAEYPDQGVEGASPLRSLVATQNVYPLCVLIDLHPEQNLVADGEISRQVLFESTSRTEVASRGNVTVWAFNHNRMWRQSAVATDLQ
jgi:hypothetical protein